MAKNDLPKYILDIDFSKIKYTPTHEGSFFHLPEKIGEILDYFQEVYRKHLESESHVKEFSIRRNYASSKISLDIYTKQSWETMVPCPGQPHYLMPESHLDKVLTKTYSLIFTDKTKINGELMSHSFNTPLHEFFVEQKIQRFLYPFPISYYSNSPNIRQAAQDLHDKVMSEYLPSGVLKMLYPNKK